MGEAEKTVVVLVIVIIGKAEEHSGCLRQKRTAMESTRARENSGRGSANSKGVSEHSGGQRQNSDGVNH